MTYPVFMVPAGDVLPVMFTSYAGSTGASVTLTGLAVTDIEIYKDGSTTQRASDAGYTLLDTDGIDFDGITGVHGFSIDTGDNTDAGFYTVGAWFTVVVSAVTIDSQTVSFIACQFRLMAAESVAAKPKVDVDAWLGTAAATPTVAGVPEVDVTHYAGSTTDVSTIPASVAAILVDTAEIGAAGAGLTVLATQTSVNTIDDFLDTEVAAIKAKTDQLTFTTANQVDATTVTVSTGAIGTGDIASAALNEIADAVLDRNMTTGTDSGSTTVRTVRQALRILRNKVSIAAGTMTVTKEDDSTSSWTAAVATTAGDPISEIDPAGP